jgi:hypothetical protein
MDLDILRPNVLAGLNVLVANGAETAAQRCAALGATTSTIDADLLDEDAVAAAVADLPCDVLIVDASAAGSDLQRLRIATDGAWNATRAVANARWTADGTPGGKVVYLAGEGATAAALENLARTLSIEWARFGITITAITGGTPGQVAELAAFLASPAGDYYSGCALSLAGTG